MKGIMMFNEAIKTKNLFNCFIWFSKMLQFTLYHLFQEYRNFSYVKLLSLQKKLLFMSWFIFDTSHGNGKEFTI